MRSGRVSTLDLHEAFSAYSLVAAPRMVDIRGVVLGAPWSMISHDGEESNTPRNRWDTQPHPDKPLALDVAAAPC